VTWQIQIPHRSVDEPLAVAAGHCYCLPGQDEVRVTRQLMIQARLDGVAATAGELIDHLHALEPHERRVMLDAARTAEGLPTIGEMEEDARVSALIRPAAGFEMQRCAIADCTATPTNDLGVPVEVDARRWHCPDHGTPRSTRRPRAARQRPALQRIRRPGAG
jgi:hypothetical protein